MIKILILFSSSLILLLFSIRITILDLIILYVLNIHIKSKDTMHLYKYFLLINFFAHVENTRIVNCIRIIIDIVVSQEKNQRPVLIRLEKLQFSFATARRFIIAAGCVDS